MGDFKRLGGLAAAGLAAVGLMAASGAQAQSLLNGDFEQGPLMDNFAAHDWRGIPNFWHSIPGLDVVDIVENGYTQSPAPILLAQSGTHFLDMNGAFAHGGIYQDVSGFTPGATLQLSLYTGRWVGNTQNEQVIFGLYDGVTQALLNSVTVSDIDSSTGWNLHSLTAVATSGVVRVRIEGLTTFQAGPGVDNVTLTAVGGGVPEPTSWALMIMGFGGAGAMLRSRRRRQAAAA